MLAAGVQNFIFSQGEDEGSGPYPLPSANCLNAGNHAEAPPGFWWDSQTQNTAKKGETPDDLPRFNGLIFAGLFFCVLLLFFNVLCFIGL
jgi:hypothetical protein